MVLAYADKFNEAKAEFRKETAELAKLAKERENEIWKEKNKEHIQLMLELERKQHEAEIAVRMTQLRQDCAKRALSLGIGVELVQQIFKLPDNEIFKL